MSNTGEIVNKVAASGIVTLDLKDLLPNVPLVSIDISQWFWQGMLLKEKEFRAHLDAHDWQQYQGAAVSVWSSQDAIVPHWAWMLVASKLSGIVHGLTVCQPENHASQLIEAAVRALDATAYDDARVVIKGCGDIVVSPGVYAALTQKLLPVVKSLMFGEPCSTVPVWKRS